MSLLQPVLEAEVAVVPGLPAITLRLAPGELLLVEPAEAGLATALADLCCGLPVAESGRVVFQGRDWARLAPDLAAAQRSRLGRVFAAGGWLPQLGMAENVLLPQLFHTAQPLATLRERAAELAHGFGLPGLPLAPPDQLTAADRLRCGLVRAFLGAPPLLLLETPDSGVPAELLPPLLDALGRARARGAACLWLTDQSALLRDAALGGRRLRLTDQGLLPPRATLVARRIA